MMSNTAVGASPDPDAFLYIAKKLRCAGRTAHSFKVSVENMVRALEDARTAVYNILEAYYFDREAQARWEDDGGPSR